MRTVEIVGKATGVGLAFALVAWTIDHLLGQPPRDYLDLILVSAFASVATLLAERRTARKALPRD
jgi:hypothetical protein